MKTKNACTKVLKRVKYDIFNLKCFTYFYFTFLLFITLFLLPSRPIIIVICLNKLIAYTAFLVTCGLTKYYYAVF